MKYGKMVYFIIIFFISWFFSFYLWYQIRNDKCLFYFQYWFKVKEVYYIFFFKKNFVIFVDFSGQSLFDYMLLFLYDLNFIFEKFLMFCINGNILKI